MRPRGGEYGPLQGQKVVGRQGMKGAAKPGGAAALPRPVCVEKYAVQCCHACKKQQHSQIATTTAAAVTATVFTCQVDPSCRGEVGRA